MAKKASEATSKLGKTIGRRIRQLRAENQWTQADLEHQLGDTIKQATLSHYEAARYMPSMSAIEQIAAAFGVHVALFFLEPTRNARDMAVEKLLTMSQRDLARALRLLGIEGNEQE